MHLAPLPHRVAPRERVVSAARRVRVLPRRPRALCAPSSSGNLLHLAGRLFWRFLLFLFGLFCLAGLPLLLLVRHPFLLHKLRLAGILALTAALAGRAILSRHPLSSGLGQTGPAASS